MPKYSQADRPMAVSTPLGPDVLLLQQFSGSEFLSRLFRFQLEMLAESSTDIAFDQILGQSVTVTLQMPDGSSRYINGIVNRFSQGQQVPSAMGSAFFTRYLAEIVPQFWLLTRKAQSRIFQQIAVPDILKQVLTGLSVDYQLQGTYKPRDYCVQYRETDFDFASRLMEEEGIYYFFTHADGSHKMVVADTTMSHPDVPGATTAIYEVVEGGLRKEDRVHSWEKRQEIRSGKYTLWDQCFELPGQNLEAIKPVLDSVQVGTVSHTLKVAGNDKLELYDFPGGYAQRFDGITPGGGDRASDIQNIFQDNARTTAIRMQQETTPALSIAGQSTCRQFTAGHKFTLDRHFNANGAYVLTHVGHSATMGDTYTTGSDTSPIYENTFECIPTALPFKPAQTTPRPTVEGTQTAVVVGNPGDEIFTDKYGRVKVQFPWDRQGQHDANSSCWVRVGDPLGGQAVGHDPHPASRPGSHCGLRGRRPRPADHRRQRLQRRADAPVRPPGQHDTKRNQVKEQQGRLAGQLQRVQVRGQEGLGTDHAPRREGPVDFGRARRVAHGRPRSHQDHRPRRDHPRQARPDRDRRQQREDHDRCRPHRDGRR